MAAVNRLDRRSTATNSADAKIQQSAPAGAGAFARSSSKRSALDGWPQRTKRPDLTDKRTNLERVGAIMQAGQRVVPFR